VVKQLTFNLLSQVRFLVEVPFASVLELVYIRSLDLLAERIESSNLSWRTIARMLELVDNVGLKSTAVRRTGSSPVASTIIG
jgi:hypothetical protein